MRQARRRTFQGQTMVYARHERFAKCVQAFKILVELFLCIANLFCRSRSIMGASRIPWFLGVFRYRLFRLYLSTDCTSMLNLPGLSVKAQQLTKEFYKIKSQSCCFLIIIVYFCNYIATIVI